MLIYQRTGLQKLVRATGLLRLLPKRLAQMEASVTTRALHVFCRDCLRGSHPLRRLGGGFGMLSGCVQQVFFQHGEPGHCTSARRGRLRGGMPTGRNSVVEPCMLHSRFGWNRRRLSPRTMIATFESANVETNCHHSCRMRLDHEGVWLICLTR